MNTLKTKFAVSLAVAGLAIGSAISTPVEAQGIPVIDVANLVQDLQQLLSFSQQLSQMEEQVNTAKSQLSTQAQQLQSISGITSMGNLLNSSTYQQARDYLPTDWQQTLALTQGAANGQYTSLSGAVQGIQQANQLYTPAQMGLTTGSPQASEEQQHTATAAVYTAAGQASYAETGQRVAQLQTFVDQIGQATTQKQILDLNTRIAAEQLFLSNEIVRLLSMQQMQKAQATTYSNQDTERQYATSAQHTDSGTILAGLFGN